MSVCFGQGFVLGITGQNLVIILKCSIGIVYTTIVYNRLHVNNIVYVKYRT